MAKTEFGWIATNYLIFKLPLLEFMSKSSLMTESSERKISKSTLVSELLKNSKKREKEDIAEKVREEVPLMQECPKKYFGLEDKES